MGSLFSKNVHRSDVETQLEKARLKDLLTIKVLLLGAGECGKSTVLKQVKLVHKIFFTKSELRDIGVNLRRNTLQSIQAMLEACSSIMPPIPLVGDEINEHAERVIGFEFEDELCHMPPQVVESIEYLWRQQPIKEVWERRTEYWCLDSVDYYFENISRFCEKDFHPDDQDCVMARIITTGIVATDLERPPLTFKLIDVGGQRTERRKWMHCFDDVKAIIYVVNLSGYASVLYEDSSVNRMHESLAVFEQTVNSEMFCKVPVYLLMNKKDLLESMLRKKPLTACFPEYSGEEGNVLQAIKFISGQFRARLTQHKERMQCHAIAARFRRDVKTVWEDITGDLARVYANDIAEATRGLTKLGVPLVDPEVASNGENSQDEEDQTYAGPWDGRAKDAAEPWAPWANEGAAGSTATAPDMSAEPKSTLGQGPVRQMSAVEVLNALEMQAMLVTGSFDGHSDDIIVPLSERGSMANQIGDLSDVPEVVRGTDQIEPDQDDVTLNGQQDSRTENEGVGDSTIQYDEPSVPQSRLSVTGEGKENVDQADTAANQTAGISAEEKGEVAKQVVEKVDSAENVHRALSPPNEPMEETVSAVTKESTDNAAAANQVAEESTVIAPETNQMIEESVGSAPVANQVTPDSAGSTSAANEVNEESVVSAPEANQVTEENAGSAAAANQVTQESAASTPAANEVNEEGIGSAPKTNQMLEESVGSAPEANQVTQTSADSTSAANESSEESVVSATATSKSNSQQKGGIESELSSAKRPSVAVVEDSVGLAGVGGD